MNFKYTLNQDFLKALLEAKSPSGYEKNATDVFWGYLMKYAQYEFKDSIGNVAFSYGSDAKDSIEVMLSGHVDEIGLQVQNIDDKGFIHFIKDGGIDAKVLLGSTVTILTKNGELKGVIGKQPIHIEWNGENKDKATKITDMKIDVGAENKEEVFEMGVRIGDPITIDDIPLMLGKNRIVGRGLDDKVGVFVTAEVIRTLRENDIRFKHLKVFGVACTQEEVSGSGAVSAAKLINPNFSIDYDVTFATDDEYVSPNEWGDIKLGKGGGIAFGPDCNPKLSNFIRETCEKENIPHQEFSVRSGGTNTVHIKKSSLDTTTALLSIPNRNMHTQVEVCDLRDLESLVIMTVATLVRLDEEIIASDEKGTKYK